VQAAEDEGIPVIAYDRLIEDARAFYLTFDNVEVGRMQARAVLEQAPEGNYVMIKGSPTDPNADFLRGGQQEVLQEAIDAGDITIVGEAYTDGWLPPTPSATWSRSSPRRTTRSMRSSPRTTAPRAASSRR
jgi:D-xylose transport system substrate-binding protein